MKPGPTFASTMAPSVPSNTVWEYSKSRHESLAGPGPPKGKAMLPVLHKTIRRRAMGILILLLAVSFPLVSTAQYRAPAKTLSWNSQPGVQMNDLLVREFRGGQSLIEGRKSEGLAFVLGLYLPGLGSLYAGNSQHFWRHFGLALLTIPAGAAAILIGPVAFYAVMAGFVANYGWSLSVAVKDVQHHNDLIINQPSSTGGVTMLRLRF
jgi:hypothetical protein